MLKKLTSVKKTVRSKKKEVTAAPKYKKKVSRPKKKRKVEAEFKFKESSLI